MLKPQENPEIMQRSVLSVYEAQSFPSSDTLRGSKFGGGRSPQPPKVWGDQENRDITPQPPLARGAQEKSGKSIRKGLTNGQKSSSGSLRQLQLIQLRLGSKNQSGFTLIECLLAILIVAILLSAVAPAIVLSVATRLQARRVEQGAQAAQTYIDGVRAGKLAASAIAAVPLDEVTVVGGKNTFEPQRNAFALTLPPASNEVTAANCLEGTAFYPYCSSQASTLYCVDMDGGGCSNSSPQDLIVQAFRSRSTAQETAEAAATDDNDLNRIIHKNGFLLGVRVYRASSFGRNAPLIGGTGKKDTTFTGGTGLKVGPQAQQAPLAEVTTEISARETLAGDRDKTSYTDMCARLGGCDQTTVTPP